MTGGNRPSSLKLDGCPKSFNSNRPKHRRNNCSVRLKLMKMDPIVLTFLYYLLWL
ncbi:hypothetical protein TcasGA2_TC033908 [Tribolium castaneum]|uniref:Uncharacterized protein n=1 Tax=Tribolium castaneum TaxID=7070 RepID=A0A139W936_TRICA|nr:hypothetical protein TcasGA2_TC033908 [Tribolium castaneum]